MLMISSFFFQAEDGIRDADVTGVQTCALPISSAEYCAAHGLADDEGRGARCDALRLISMSAHDLLARRGCIPLPRSPAMRTLFRTLLLTGAFLAIAPAVQAEDDLARIREAGEIRIGTEGTYAPFTFHDSDGLTGFDVEIGRAIAEQIGRASCRERV